MENERHDKRCPLCKRFVEADADGFYDRLDRDDEESYVAAFCNEGHANQYHQRLQRSRDRFADLGVLPTEKCSAEIRGQS